MGVHRLKKQHSAPSLGGGGSGSGSSSGSSMPPKGCMAVRVVGPATGGGNGGRKEEQQAAAAAAAEQEEERFVVPVGYLKHPLFVALLKAAEDEYGFEQKGAITIPCGVDHFRRVQGIIHHQRHHHNHHHGGHHSSSSSSNHFHIAGCFRA